MSNECALGIKPGAHLVRGEKFAASGVAYRCKKASVFKQERKALIIKAGDGS